MTSRNNSNIHNNKVIGAVMMQNKAGGGEFLASDEGILTCFADFVAVGRLNTELQERAILMSTSLHGEFKGMNDRIEELLAGKRALESAEDMLKTEEEGGIARARGLRSLVDLEEELDRQSEVVDALLH